MPSAPTAFMSAEQYRAHWQGHRALTRRVISAFPDDTLFSYAVGGMRPFGAMAAECLGMAVPTLDGILTGTWGQYAGAKATTKDDLLTQWDAATTDIDRLFPQIPAARFQEVDTAFGQWKMPVYELLLYVRDNEIHHRGQGYVYLRTLGIEPPAFWER